MIKNMLRKASKCGVKFHNFPKWLHRKYGDMVVWRFLKDGSLANALPCVMCRKAIEKYNIQWIAYTGDEWTNSLQSETVPKSKPTVKQKRLFTKKTHI